MQNKPKVLDGQTILITGAAHRLGAVMAEYLHGEGANIVLHYRSSRTGAEALEALLNRRRPGSVCPLQGDLLDFAALPALVEEAASCWGRVDALINNASSFYPTPMGEVTEAQWDDLLGTNLKAPFFLSQAAAPWLRRVDGSILNIVDIHAERPLRGYPAYSIAKAGLAMLTRALAAELGPEIRVNGIAPGAILWPENMAEEAKRKIIGRTFLKRRGEPEEIARTARFLIAEATYITGQVVAVDGGRSLNA